MSIDLPCGPRLLNEIQVNCVTASAGTEKSHAPVIARFPDEVQAVGAQSLREFLDMSRSELRVEP